MMIPELRHTTIIGFGHRSRQGKDTAVRTLERFAPGRARRFAFADALRAVCRVQHGMTVKDAPLLQDVGVNWRSRDPDVWVRACMWSIYEWDLEATEAQAALISDVRFLNEAEMILALGGKLIRVQRTNRDGSLYISDDRPSNHISETELDNFDWPHTITAPDVPTLEREVQRLAWWGLPEVFAPSVFDAPLPAA